MRGQSLYHSFQRYRTLQTHRITALPIVILMPHSACNCRCIMCDIWKDNGNLKQLTEDDIRPILFSLKKLGAKQVLMSGGEALLHPRFFQLCQLLKGEGLYISLHTTGLLLKKHSARIVELVDDVIVSIDGDRPTHDEIRNIPGAYLKLAEGINAVRVLNPAYRITSRTVIHKLNFRRWPNIISSAKSIGIDQVSFLPADVSSQAFNRETPWAVERQGEVALSREELPALKQIVNELISEFDADFENRFIAESPDKLLKIYDYYNAIHGLSAFPFKRCNAPWVSAVIEADGSVRPCFFHEALGNIHTQSLPEILNGEPAMAFRKELDMDNNEICKRCVCSLHLPAGMNPVQKT